MFYYFSSFWSDPRGGEQAAGAGPGADQPRHLPLLPADPLPPPHPGHPLKQGEAQIRPQGQHRPDQVGQQLRRYCDKPYKRQTS